MKTMTIWAVMATLTTGSAFAQDAEADATEAAASEAATSEATPAPMTAAEAQALREQLAASQALLQQVLESQSASQAVPQPAPTYAPPPGYGYGAPTSAAVARNEAYLRWRSMPDKMPFREDEGIPEGYRMVSRRRTGAMVAGGTMLGVGWLGSTIAAAADLQADHLQTLAPLYVPVVGPWIAMGLDGQRGDLTPMGGWALALDGVVQGAGLGLLVWGGVNKRQLLEKKAFSLTSVMPSIREDGAGVHMAGRF